MPNLIEISKLAYFDFLSDQEIEKQEDYDNEDSDNITEIEDVQLLADSKFLSYVITNKEELIRQYIIDFLNNNKQINISSSIETSLEGINLDVIKIEIMGVEIQGNINDIYKCFMSSVSPSEMLKIETAMYEGDFSLFENCINNIVKKDGDKILAEEEITIFYYKVPFDIKSVSELNEIEENLNRSLKEYLDSFSNEEGFFEF